MDTSLIMMAHIAARTAELETALIESKPEDTIADTIGHIKDASEKAGQIKELRLMTAVLRNANNLARLASSNFSKPEPVITFDGAKPK